MRRRGSSVLAATGLGVVAVLVVAAIVVPRATDWNVHVFTSPPLHADWRPRIGPGTPFAVALAVLAVVLAPRLARRLSWRLLLVGAFVAALAWMLALATVDGRAGIGHILDTPYEYLRTARRTHDVPAMLREYVDRIPYSNPRNWPVHLAGHPPGAVLFFIALVKLGLSSGFQAGLAVAVVAATTPVAVLIAVRALADEATARTVAPFLVFGPVAIWSAVSADAVFAATAAWGLCCLAVGARRRSAWLSVLAGLLLGFCVYESYGLVLLGVLAVAVLVVARSWFPLGWAVGGALAVVATFTAYGFRWWDAYPVLRERYFDGVASRRPTSYWAWANFAAFAFSAGPAVGASVALAWGRARDLAARRFEDPRNAVAALTIAAFATIVLADASGMSKAEVERIWVPFVPWMLLGCTLLPRRLRRPVLALQVVAAVVVQHLYQTGW